uniref:Dynein axonemal intermediate chain 4 n=1 Tax=Eptatretus burgeri TaxID=7764 RepID=A0A8C4QPT9_EPTBU
MPLLIFLLLSEMMQLKRSRHKTSKIVTGKPRHCEVTISHVTAGFSIHFFPKDSSTYLVGTEEGVIHKSTSACNEQSVKYYWGHKGPVYNVLWSPFHKDIFASCSEDGHAYIWHTDRGHPVFDLYTEFCALQDIAWSTVNSTVLATSSHNALHLWDLNSKLYPVLVIPASESAALSRLLFVPGSDVLLVGDCDGQVSVYHTLNLNTQTPDPQGEVLAELTQTTLTRQLQLPVSSKAST